MSAFLNMHNKCHFEVKTGSQLEDMMCSNKIQHGCKIDIEPLMAAKHYMEAIDTGMPVTSPIVLSRCGEHNVDMVFNVAKQPYVARFGSWLLTLIHICAMGHIIHGLSITNEQRQHILDHTFHVIFMNDDAEFGDTLEVCNMMAAIYKDNTVSD